MYTVHMSIEIPDWVHWLAQDADGQWWGYEAEPNMKHNGWYENEVGRRLKLLSTKANPEWQTTLKKVR